MAVSEVARRMTHERAQLYAGSFNGAAQPHSGRCISKNPLDARCRQPLANLSVHLHYPLVGCCTVVTRIAPGLRRFVARGVLVRCCLGRSGDG